MPDRPDRPKKKKKKKKDKGKMSTENKPKEENSAAASATVATASPETTVTATTTPATAAAATPSGPPLSPKRKALPPLKKAPGPKILISQELNQLIPAGPGGIDDDKLPPSQSESTPTVAASTAVGSRRPPQRKRTSKAKDKDKEQTKEEKEEEEEEEEPDEEEEDKKGVSLKPITKRRNNKARANQKKNEEDTNKDKEEEPSDEEEEDKDKQREKEKEKEDTTVKVEPPSKKDRKQSEAGSAGTPSAQLRHNPLVEDPTTGKFKATTEHRPRSGSSRSGVSDGDESKAREASVTALLLRKASMSKYSHFLEIMQNVLDSTFSLVQGVLGGFSLLLFILIYSKSGWAAFLKFYSPLASAVQHSFFVMTSVCLIGSVAKLAKDKRNQWWGKDLIFLGLDLFLILAYVIAFAFSIANTPVDDVLDYSDDLVPGWYNNPALLDGSYDATLRRWHALNIVRCILCLLAWLMLGFLDPLLKPDPYVWEALQVAKANLKKTPAPVSAPTSPIPSTPSQPGASQVQTPDLPPPTITTSLAPGHEPEKKTE